MSSNVTNSCQRLLDQGANSLLWVSEPHLPFKLAPTGRCVGIQGDTEYCELHLYPWDHLLNAWLVGVEQRPGLHVFRYEAAAHAGDVLPVS